MNSNYSLEETILDTELRHTKFFNGRLLTGGDLQADHLPEWLPKRKTGDGVEGGTFESWFTI